MRAPFLGLAKRPIHSILFKSIQIALNIAFTKAMLKHSIQYKHRMVSVCFNSGHFSFRFMNTFFLQILS